MTNFSDSEQKLRSVISNKSFIWNGEKFTTGKAYKPQKKGSGGECKTDCYVLATKISDKKKQEIKITYKMENASFVENKCKQKRVKTIFGEDWSNIIKKQINLIKEKFQKEPLFYLIQIGNTKQGSIKLGWRYEMEHNAKRTLGTTIEEKIAKYVWENNSGNHEFRNCPVNGVKIKNSGVPNFAFIKNAEKFNSIEDIFLDLIPIEDIIKNGSITTAFTAQNYNPIRDYQGGGTKRDLSVPIDWSLKNGEATAKLIFDKPLEINSNIQLEKLKVVLEELEIPVGKEFDISKFYKKLNPNVIVLQ